MDKQPEASTQMEGGPDKNVAIIEAFHIARENGIAGYAIEGKYGWSANARKPSLRFGKVLECRIDGSVVHA